MIELQHRQVPTPSLTTYLQTNTSPTVADFDSATFLPIKILVKADLNQDQGGLCVYCERKLSPNKGQVEHIKPKSGRNPHPSLCFVYNNYAHSCINDKTCGQKKRDGLLPIEPKPGCNAKWKIISTNGMIEPLPTLNKKDRHSVVQTRDMLGLNKDTNLVADRKDWFDKVISILKNHPDSINDYLKDIPFRAIIAASLP